MVDEKVKPTRMKAFVKVGSSLDAIERGTMPVPEPGSGELLVAIKAIGVGVHDAYFLPEQIEYPHTVGLEGSGEVVQVGPGVHGYAPGDRIAFVSMGQRKGGTWAEYAVVAVDGMVVPVPAKMSWTEAAAVPIPVSTALRAISALNPEEGETLFVAGASGAVGTASVQLARRAGFRVAGSASPPNHDHLIAMGADKAVDYRDPDWVEEIRAWSNGGVDAAIAVLRDTTESTMDVVRDSGRVVTVSADDTTSKRSIAVLPLDYGMEVREPVTRLMEDAIKGSFQIVLARTAPFEGALDALAQTQRHRARGKLVIDMEADSERDR